MHRTEKSRVTPGPLPNGGGRPRGNVANLSAVVFDTQPAPPCPVAMLGAAGEVGRRAR
jgi:hypothetical protein